MRKWDVIIVRAEMVHGFAPTILGLLNELSIEQPDRELELSAFETPIDTMS